MGGILSGQLAIAPIPLTLPQPNRYLLSQSQPMLGRDAIPYPPLLRHESSPAGTYHLVLTLEQDATGARRTTASLFETMGDRCQQVWARRLPHSYGPRLGLVTDRGIVVLLDEWINVASSYALVVMGPDGEVKAQHSFDDIVAVTDQSRAEVVEQAAQGFWLAGNPVINRGGSQVSIPTAGGRLTLDLTTGNLGF
ncbi:hypothetical protein IQ265_06605 [Nodosilinea sp. LEGE 06152]|uniref:hypothetical protein n=1 Tax=Nodosilinea sp. LEGE 06152 TaxID=2777966 RepID=UPI00187E9A84|nr:hypothetical protein [Nodosilinea sp. LEGE 06152]MBE9156500.1 hypothetical protein [Nodosilinea sp. LEGE 06152]